MTILAIFDSGSARARVFKIGQNVSFCIIYYDSHRTKLGVLSDKQQATVSNLTHYAESYDHVAGSENNLLDKALAECSEKLAKTENVCLLTATLLPIVLTLV